MSDIKLNPILGYLKCDCTHTTSRNFYEFSCNFLNEILTSGLLRDLSIKKFIDEFLNSWGPVSMLTYFVLSFFSTWLIWKHKNSKFAMLLAEISAWLQILVPIFLPWKAVRFFWGLQIFTSSMSLHGRICGYVQNKKLTASCDNLNSLLIENDSSDSLHSGLLQTYFYNLPPKLDQIKNNTPPKLHRILYFMYICLFADLNIWAMQEAIPTYVSPQNQYNIKAFVAGVWVLFSMDIAYNNGIMLLDLEGSPLPYEMRHRHPLLSTSLAEFWGSRWNPIIGKLLQEAFYKPVRRLEFSRVTAMLACFSGSAILHAYPQYISTYSLLDASMMFSFFFLQGLLVLLESYASSNLGMKNFFTHQISTRIKFQWISELITIIFFLLLVYFILETKFSSSECETLSVVAICMFGCIYVLNLQSESEDTQTETTLKNNSESNISTISSASSRSNSSSSSKKRPRSWTVLIGWFWTVSSIIGALPLFSLPVYNAVESFYSRSFIIGPFLRNLKTIDLGM